MHHEVRLRAAAWARRLVRDHGQEAEAVVEATLRRPNLSQHERLAARYTKQALASLRRVEGYVSAPRRRRTSDSLAAVIGRLIGRRPRPPSSGAIGDGAR